MNQLLPEIFLCGFPKSGTTTLVAALETTGHFCLGKLKEPNYYCRDIIPQYTPAPTKKLYMENYSECPKYKIRIDASVTTIYSDAGLNNIKKNISNPKFIVAVRNPLEMGISLHSFLYAIGHENEANFEKAIGLIDKRKLGKDIPPASQVPFYLDYINCVKVSSRIDLIKSMFGEKAVKVVIFDDLISNKIKVLTEICEFLQVEAKVDVAGAKWENRTLPLTRDKLHYIFIWALNFKARLGIKRGIGISKIYFRLRTSLVKNNTSNRNNQPTNYNEGFLKVCYRELEILNRHIPHERVEEWKIKFGKITGNL